MNYFCPKCGCQRTQDAKFCPKCGNAFDGVQPLPPSPPNYTGYYQQPPQPNYTGYHQQPYQQSVYQKPAEKPKRSLYDKVYRTFGGMLFLTLAGVGLLIPSVILICTLIEDVLILLLSLFSSMAIIAMAIVTPIIISHRKLSKSSLRKERVVLRNKEQFETYIPHGGVAIRQSFTFEFPDGGTKSLFLRSKHMRASGMYDLSIAGDSGTLVYQELNGKMRLVDFENDNFTVNSKRSLYDKVHHTQGGHVFSVLAASLSVCPMLIGLMFAFVPLYDPSFFASPITYFIAITLLLFLPAALIGFIYIPRLYVYLKLKGNPEKQLQVKEEQTQVKLIDKGNFGKHANDITRNVLVFELPDKSRKSFHVHDADIYNLALVNDTGILTYKERKDEAVFISFEREKIKGFL